VHSRGLLETPFDTHTEEEKKKQLAKWHFGTNGQGGRNNKRSGSGSDKQIGGYSLADVGAAIKSAVSQGKRGFVDLSAQLDLLGPVHGKREWEEFESLASSLGVQPDDIAAAKKAAAENLSPQLQQDIMAAVRNAVSSSQQKRALPGPAFLFRARDVEEEQAADREADRAAVQSLLSVDAKVTVLGAAPEGETGVLSTDSGAKHGVPLVVAGSKRQVEDEIEGAPGYIDITVS
jgi:hypothetical protein